MSGIRGEVEEHPASNRARGDKLAWGECWKQDDTHIGG